MALDTVRVFVWLQVTAVSSVGLAEGSSHVNWQEVRYNIDWWVVGCGVVILCTLILWLKVFLLHPSFVLSILLPGWMHNPPHPPSFRHAPHPLCLLMLASFVTAL